MKILITYSTSQGATQSIAERIQARIDAANIGDTTLLPVSKNISIEAFDVLIIGSALHVGSWLSPASKFVKANTIFLRENPKPTWAFSVGMPAPGAAEEAEEEKMEKWLRKSIALRGHKLFQGMWNSEKLGVLFKCIFSCFGGKYEDRRNWDAIDEWADGIVRELRIDQQGSVPLGS
jgi:menaquinone-dependent protoporphyrinogen oxidase